MLLVKALVMGVVEGVTEFLPISSTGHLILAGAVIDYPEAQRVTMELFIQMGAILAVFWHYARPLSDLATRLESYYAKTNTYSTATIGTGNVTDVLPVAATNQGYYTLAIDAANTTATTYSITAAPVGVQTGDTRCATLIINSLNVRTVSGTAPATSCW